MNILIFGAGAIGCHIAYCLKSRENSIFLISRGQHYTKLKTKGLKLEIYNNKNLEKKILLKETKNFVFFNDVNKINKKIKFDYIFITLKIHHINKKIIEKISKLINENTAVIPPCTNIPFWFFGCYKKNIPLSDEEKFYLKLIKCKNIIGMTLWLSAKITKPGYVRINHTQRGYPLKELNTKMKNHADLLRKMFKSKSKSPIVKNIRGEIFIKSLNALSFNLIALISEKNNYDLNRDKSLKLMIKKIMLEGEKILKKENIPFFQSADARINQTLSSSVHTMSMLSDFKKGKTLELETLWKSFENASNIAKISMPFTCKTIQKFRLKLIQFSK